MKFEIFNPIDTGWYADPEARYYEGKYMIYVTHSQPYEIQQNQSCFVSTDLTHWEKHENIIDMSGFPWVVGAVWAPTVEEKNGKYYYVFASNNVPRMSECGGLEIAVSDSPTGPFRAYLGKPLISGFHNGAQPIDAHLFKDEDGTMYLYYGGWGHCNIAIMNQDMTGFLPFPDGEFFKEITPKHYTEGPCVFKRKGKYHFMWSAGDWANGTYHVNTAVSDTPWGPFTNVHTILSNDGCSFANGPGHNGYFYLPKQDQYLMVYHRHSNEIKDGNARFICIDRMDMDKDGNILPVKMTEHWCCEEQSRFCNA